MYRATIKLGGASLNPAYNTLKQLILSCKLKPGERLIQANVAQELGMTRAAVHQAFDRLMVEDLVDVVPRRGVVVKPIVIAELLQMVEVRRINELYSARRAASYATAAQIDLITSIVHEASRAVSDQNIDEVINLDANFHRALADCSNNYELSEVISRMNERSARFWIISNASQDNHRKFQAQHLRILNTLQARDPDAAEAAMADHIDSFRESLVRQIFW